MNKKINQLGVRTAVGTDLALVGDPSTGTSYKTTIAELPLVPYTGATGAVNLGAYDLTVNSLTVGKGNGSIAFNTVSGVQAGLSFTTANASTAIGYNSLKLHQTGNWNTAIGYLSMAQDVDGIGNTALGTTTLSNLTTGANTGNTAIGINTLNRLTSGSYNTHIGYGIATAGILTSGSYNTILGAQVNVGVATLNNNIILADGQGNIRFRDDATSTILSRLAGTGTRMVVTDTNGALSTQAIPTLSSGGYSLSYYLNGGTAASVGTYYQMSKTAVLGTGVDFTLTGNGLISQFLTDVSDPNRLEIPGGNWNFEMYFSISSVGGNTAFYVELLKYNGTTFTSIASSVSTPEEITNGTTIDVYTTSLAIPQTTLLATDRLALRVYIVNNSGGRTVTLHTQDSHLCEIITNFAGGVSALNGLTANTQYFATGTSGTNFAIVSSGDTHTFNLPTASGTNRGALSSADWTSFYNKQAALTLTTTGTSGAATLVGATLNIPQYSGGGGMVIGGAITSATAGSVLFAGTSGVLQQDNANLFWDDTNNRLGIGTATPSVSLELGTSTLGAEQLINSTIGSNIAPAIVSGNYTVNADYSISSGVWTKSGIAGFTGASIGLSISAGSTYEFSVTVTWTSGNPILIYLGSILVFTISASGTYTKKVTTLSNQQLIIPYSTGRLSFSAITIKLLSIGNLTVDRNLSVNGNFLAQNGTSSFSIRNDGNINIYNKTILAPLGWNNGDGVNFMYAPSAKLEIISDTLYTGNMLRFISNSEPHKYFTNFNHNAGVLTISQQVGSTNYANPFVIDNGNILLNTVTNAGYRLDVNGTARVSGKLTITAGTTAASQINLASSTAPTTPNNGDIWFTGTELKIQVGGVTKTFTLI